MRRLRLLRRRGRRRDQEAVAPGEHDQPDDPSYAANDSLLDYAEEELAEREFQPFVPVEAGAHDDYDASEGDEVPDDFTDRRRPSQRRLRIPRFSVKRPLAGWDVQVGVLIGAISLMAAGVLGTLLNRRELAADIEAWWPIAIIVGAVAWMLAGLLKRRAALFLGAAAFVGLGISLLLETQDIAVVQESLLGVVLVTIGLGIVMRGFLLRQQAA